MNYIKEENTFNDMENYKKSYEEFPKGISPSKHSKSDSEIEELKNKAKKYLDGETAAYELKQSKSRSSEYSWLKTALSQGTTSDKIAASVVLIQDSPKHNLSRLSFLVSQVRVSKHNQCTDVILALRDLFLNDLLRPDHTLLTFKDQNLDEIDGTNKTNKFLIYWYFEDQLKEVYSQFIQALSAIATNAIESNREKAVSVMNDLLMGNPEQEHKLLELLVNKIGDPSGKVTSKVVFCLLKLLHEHPNMKIIVLKEVEKLLFRKNISQRVQYYAICLLTQFVLDKEDEDTATYLIDVYFAFFKATLKKGEPRSKMMAAILTGVNRAYPFAKIENLKIQDHIDSVYKVVHFGSFKVSFSALNLLFQVVGRDATQSNRFYSAFYRKLMDPQIGVAHKRAVFLNLLFRALRNDPSVMRVAAFIKRILQVSLYFPANMVCATLYVIAKILQIRKDLRRIIVQSQRKITDEVKSEITSDNDLMNNDFEDKVLNKLTQDSTTEETIILSNVTTQPTSTFENNLKEDVEKIEENTSKSYDPFCRNPLHAGAYNASFMELYAFTMHYHPSVALFANNIIEEKNIDYTGDPLEDLTLIRFLDRYVFKNPKKLNDKDRAKKNDPLSQRAVYDPKGLKKLPVDSVMYLNEQEDRIPVDELFLHKYLTRRKQTKMKSADNDSDNESVNSEDFNTMLDSLSKSDDIDSIDIATEFTESAKRIDKEMMKVDDDKESDLNEQIDDSHDEEDDEMKGSDDVEDEEFENLSDLDLDDVDDDASEIDFDNESDNEMTLFKKKQGKEKTESNVFMSAEKFAEMLEEQGLSKIKHGMSNVLNDADGSHFKQLRWEMDRNQKLSNFPLNKRKGKKGSKFYDKNKTNAKRQKR